MSTVFVGNLSPEVTDTDLREAFGAFGKIRSLRLISRRGLAFIEMKPEHADAAVEALRGTEFKGRPIDVTVEQGGGGRPKGGGRRGGGGRRRR
ncbi:MAG: RNA-binding protein [Dehalococcoidia bacterium]